LTLIEGFSNPSSFLYHFILCIVELVFIMNMHEMFADGREATNNQSILFSGCKGSLATK
jgi:hypothetical protein